MSAINLAMGIVRVFLIRASRSGGLGPLTGGLLSRPKKVADDCSSYGGDCRNYRAENLFASPFRVGKIENTYKNDQQQNSGKSGRSETNFAGFKIRAVRGFNHYPGANHNTQYNDKQGDRHQRIWIHHLLPVKTINSQSWHFAVSVKAF